MQPCKLRAAPWLALILVLASVVAVPGAILEKGSQLINLVNPTVNNGQFLFTEMFIRDTNGDLVRFTGTDQALVITRIYWNFTASDSSMNHNIQLNIGNYYRQGGKLVNGFVSNNDIIIPGVAVTNFAANIFVSDMNNPDLVPISGTMSMRLVGYLAPNL